MNADSRSAHDQHDCNIRIVPYGEDPLGSLGRYILERHASQLPDLSHITILLPRFEAAPRLRSLLLHHAHCYGCDALLGPQISDLQSWLLQQVPAQHRLLTGHARELLLVEVLRNHDSLFGSANPWVMCEYLLELFDELSLNHIILPQSGKKFSKQLADAYGVSKTPGGLTQEATIVHTLWRAYQQQLAAADLADHTSTYASALDRYGRQIPVSHDLYATGFTRLSASEISCWQRLMQKQRLTVFLHGQCHGNYASNSYHPDSPVERICCDLDIPFTTQAAAGSDSYCLFLNTVYRYGAENEALYDDTTTFHARAQDFARRYPVDPTKGRLYFYLAPDFESEARAVEIQLRRWLLEGRQEIAIVTEDRRLARRIRALLERAGILLQDSGGWALSTTQAAAALERWLETIEGSFSQETLIDLLKSPFILPRWDAAERLAVVYRFEQDIILEENLSRGLDRYRRHTLCKLKTRRDWPGDRILQLLDEIEHAAEPLLKQHRSTGGRPQQFLDALETSMQRLGLGDRFQGDAAGCRILEELDHMRRAAAGSQLRFTWHECRLWLGRALERVRFQPQASHPKLHLLSLEQSALMRFDAVIIAAADRQHLPAETDHGPFFNQDVRRTFALPTRLDQLNNQFHHFRRLLESAPFVCITARRDQESGEVITSQWVELLHSFHHLAYHEGLSDNALAAHVENPSTHVINRSFGTVSRPISRPAPRITATLQPHTISASSYQRLMDCPYQFYAANILNLAAENIVSELLEKADYGQRIHLILAAFHGGVAGIPGPFKQALSPNTRAAAVDCLKSISRSVFAGDINDNIWHLGWLRYWERQIEAYIDWQCKRGDDWKVSATELSLVCDDLFPGVRLNGRLDRVDHNGTACSIIDYKTGSTPRQEDVDSGEAVQLPFYALLMKETVASVTYLVFSSDAVKTRPHLESQQLRELKNRIGQRLQHLLGLMKDSTPLPAWGDEGSCKYCQMSGICRRQSWQHQPAPVDIAGHAGSTTGASS